MHINIYHPKFFNPHTYITSSAEKQQIGYNSKWLGRPGRWLTLYLIFTVVGFLVLPFKFEHINPWLTTSYSLIVWFCFYCGQYASTRTNYIIIRPVEKFHNVNIFAIGLYVYAIFVIILLMISYGHDLNTSSLLQNIMNPGDSYFNKFDIQNELGDQKSLIAQLYTLFQVLILLVVPVTFWYWQELSTSVRIIAIGAIFIKLLPGLLTGTMVDIGLVAVEVTVSTIALVATNRVSQRVTRMLWRFSLIMVLIFLIFAVNALLARMDTLNIQPWLVGQLPNYNPDNPLAHLIGGRTAYGILSLISYVTHGYEGLGQCLQIEFVWTFGIGHSRALMEYVEQYLGWHWIWDQQYLWRNQLKTGRHPLIFWSTSLPWIASDVTFVGVLPVTFLIGRIFGHIWKQILEHGNPLILAIFIRLVVLVLFLPANFQIFQSRPMWWGTIGLILLWLVSKVRSHKFKIQNRLPLTYIR